MIKKLNLLGIVTIFLCFLGCSKNDASEIRWDLDPTDWDYTNYGLITDGDDILEPSPQVKRNRVYEPKAEEEIRVIGWYPESEEAGLQDEILYRVVRIEVDPTENYLYAFDSEGYAVKKFFLEDGRLATQYGGAIGEGPGEFKRPSGFGIAADGRVLISDAILQRVSIFDSEGNHLNDTRYPFRVENIVVINNGKYVIPLSATMQYSELYGVFDSEGNQGASFMQFSNDPRLNVGLSGILINDRKNILTHVVSYTGHLVGYSYDQDILFYRSNLDGDREFPKWIKATISGTNRETFRIDPTAIEPITYSSINIWENELYVLRIDMEADTTDQVSVDVYATTNGDYLYSLHVPNEDCSRIHFVTNQHIYTHCEDRGIVQWARPDKVTLLK